MIDLKIPTFLYQVNTTELSKHFKEYARPNDKSPYWQYTSKSFYGAVIRSQISLVSLDLREVVLMVRLKGRSDSQQMVTGIKIDLIEPDDSRIDKYGINLENLQEARMEVTANVASNIYLNPEPVLASAFFFKKRTSVINFVAVDH